jgi:peptidyl-prolyl cis-trans isomerase B (cyclophilin B)
VVSSSKRDRAQARKRHEKWLARQEVASKRHERNMALGWSLAIVVALGVIIFAVRPSPPSTTDDVAADETSILDESATEENPEALDPTETESPEDSDLSQDAETGEDAGTANDAAVPDPALAEDRAWTGAIETNQGSIAVEIDGAAAPQAVANFVSLAGQGFFDGTACHRLTTEGIYVLQCGNPLGLEGDGDPGYSWGPIENAPADDVYPAGTIAMARVGGDGNSMGSQFFIVYEDSTISSDAAGGYTVFGRVTEGLDVVTAIAEAGVADGADGPPATPVTIERVQLQ